MKNSLKTYAAMLALVLPVMAGGAACSSSPPDNSSPRCSTGACDAKEAAPTAAPPALAKDGVAHVSLNGDARAGKIVLYAADHTVSQRIEYTIGAASRHVVITASDHSYDLLIAGGGKDITVVFDGHETVIAKADDATRSWQIDEHGRALLTAAEKPIATAMHAIDALTPREVKLAPDARPAPAAGGGNVKAPGAPAAGGSGGGIKLFADGPCTDQSTGQTGRLYGANQVNGTAYGNWTKSTGCEAAQQDVNNKCTNAYCWGCYSVNQNWCSCNCIVGDTLCAYCGITGLACGCYVDPNGSSSSSSTGGGGGSSSGGSCHVEGETCYSDDDCCSGDCEGEICEGGT